MKITTNQQVIDKFVKTAEAYAARAEDGRVNHRSAILVEADEEKNTVVFTAEGDLRAIRLVALKGIQVEIGGAALVPAAAFKTVVSNITSGDDVSIESDSTNLKITSGKRSLSLGILAIQEVPKIGDVGESETIFKSSDFAEGFRGGSAAAESGFSTIASNVFLRFEGKRGVFISRDSKSADVKYVPIKKSGSKIESMLSRATLNSSIEQITGGEEVRISVAENGSNDVHFVSETEEVERHVRISASAHEPSAFRADTYLKVVKSSAESALSVVIVNRKDFINTMKSADSIFALNYNGVERDIAINVRKDSLVISVKNTSAFEDTIDAKVFGEGAKFKLRWNQFTSLFDSYPIDRDELVFVVIPKGDKIQSLMLIDNEDFRIGDEADDLDYIALAAASN